MLPDAGDIAWVEFDQTRGTEQFGRRPALVLSDAHYHRYSPRAVVCPISTVGRRWPFDVALPAGVRAKGFVLVDQIRTIDRETRMFRIIERVSGEFLEAVRIRVAQLIGLALK